MRDKDLANWLFDHLLALTSLGESWENMELMVWEGLSTWRSGSPFLKPFFYYKRAFILKRLLREEL